MLFSQLDETTGKVYGFDAAIYLSLVRYILGDETKYDYTQMTSDTRESVLQNDNVDAVFATYSINEKRKEVISFAGPYFTTQQGILVAADNQDINGLDDLKGKKVAVQSGSTGPQVVEEFAPEAELQEFSKDDECRAALEQGRVDAYVVDMTLHMGNVVKNPGKYRIAGDALRPRGQVRHRPQARLRRRGLRQRLPREVREGWQVGRLLQDLHCGPYGRLHRSRASRDWCLAFDSLGI